MPEELIERIDERCGPDESRSEWIKRAIRRELGHEHDDLEELEARIAALEAWKDDVMVDVINHYKGEFGSAH